MKANYPHYHLNMRKVLRELKPKTVNGKHERRNYARKANYNSSQRKKKTSTDS